MKRHLPAMKTWLDKILATQDAHSPSWQRMTLISIATGMVFRIWQYIANPSIWVDEAALARNILDRRPWQLFGPLDYGQVAPRGFLLSIKLISSLFGPSEYSLRLFPFIAGLVSIVLFFIVARSVLHSIGLFVATLLFSIAIPLIFFASNLKPYSSDIAVTLFIFCLTFWLRNYPLEIRSTFGFALVSFPLLFFSQVAVFPLTIAGIIVLMEGFIKHSADRWQRFAIASIWAVVVIVTIAYSFWAMKPEDHAYAHRFWTSAFPPSDHTLTWAWTAFRNIFANSPQANNFDGAFHYPAPELFAILAVLGAIALCIEAPATGALLVGPLVLVFVASVFEQFPFGTRLSLFLLPELILMMVAGMEKISHLLKRFLPSTYISVLLLPFAFMAILHELPPYRPEHIRPVLYYIQDHWRTGDALWVYYGAGQAFQYYAKLMPFHEGIYAGECNRAKPRSYLRQLDVLRWRPRVWILLSHGSGRFRFNERKLIIDYLDTIGTKLDQFHAPPEDHSSDRAEVLLYDLSNPQKLASTSASQFEFDSSFPPVLWACYSTMSPLGPSRQILDDLMQPDNH